MAEAKPVTKLTKGSRYKIVSKKDENGVVISEGEFQGYVQFGQDSGLCILMDQGLEGRKITRIVPSINVLYIDVIEAKEEEEVKKKETPLVSYG